MRFMGRVLVALGLVAASVAPAVASPNGVWELETRDTRIQLELCGNGGQLCGHHQRNDQQREAAQQQYQRTAQVPPHGRIAQALEARMIQSPTSLK